MILVGAAAQSFTRSQSDQIMDQSMEGKVVLNQLESCKIDRIYMYLYHISTIIVARLFMKNEDILKRAYFSLSKYMFSHNLLACT